MEDFVGRSDRRLAPVIEAAWRAGAGMDAWFEALIEPMKHGPGDRRGRA